MYKTCYVNIRSVNQLLKNLRNTPMQAFNKQKVRAEAHFLRAWYYAMLVKHYGGVPLIGDALLDYETPIDFKRSSYEQCVNYILAECDSGAAVLPMVQTGQDYGRASKGACLALKSRVLLYAASPLFNGTNLPAEAKASGGFDKKLVGYETFSAERWKAAADAARALIGSTYSLNTAVPSGVNSSVKSNPGYGFQYLFPQRENTEYIFELMRPDNTDLEDLFLPPSRAGNGGGAFPSQALVDAFPMRNGKLITDPTSGYDPANPYANRDPRLDYTIIHDQTVLLVRTSNGLSNGSAPVNIFLGTYNGIASGQDAVRQGTKTGYYNNKMLDPNGLAGTIAFKTKRVLPLIRYAEILLNFAEATNEYSGPTSEVYAAMKAIRDRAGLSPSDLPPGLSKDDMRTYIQNERRIELAYEEHRFWDVRRWKIAPVTENIQAMGMEVNRNNNTVTYNKFNTTKHNFREAMYLWPFPLAETGKSQSLVQNPGY